MQNKTIDVAMELSKNEIVENINKICNKNGLPLCLLNIILANILNEVNIMSQQELQKNMSNYTEKKEKGDKNVNKTKNSNNG